MSPEAPYHILGSLSALCICLIFRQVVDLAESIKLKEQVPR